MSADKAIVVVERIPRFILCHSATAVAQTLVGSVPGPRFPREGPLLTLNLP